MINGRSVINNSNPPSPHWKPSNKTVYLDEYRVYNRSLSEAEIQSLYAAGSNPSGSIQHIVLTPSSPNAVIEAGKNAVVFGTKEPNSITIKKGALVKIINNPGTNTITIEADSTEFKVSRSGAMVTFEAEDATDPSNPIKTVIKLPATKTNQIIKFNNGSLNLSIASGKVKLGGQEITKNSVPIPDISEGEEDCKYKYFHNDSGYYKYIRVCIKKDGKRVEKTTWNRSTSGHYSKYIQIYENEEGIYSNYEIESQCYSKDILYEHSIVENWYDITIIEVIRDEIRDSNGSWKLVNKKEGVLMEGGLYWKHWVYREPCSNSIGYDSHIFLTPHHGVCLEVNSPCFFRVANANDDNYFEVITPAGEGISHWSFHAEIQDKCNNTILGTIGSLLSMPEVIANSSYDEIQNWMIINNPLPSLHGYMPPGSCANWWTHYNEETGETVTCED